MHPRRPRIIGVPRRDHGCPGAVSHLVDRSHAAQIIARHDDLVVGVHHLRGIGDFRVTVRNRRREALERRMIHVDARIDHPDLDAFPSVRHSVRERLHRVRNSMHLHRVIQQRAMPRHRVNPAHVRHLAQFGRTGFRQRHRQSVDQRIVAMRHRPAQCTDARFRGNVLRRDLRAPRGHQRLVRWREPGSRSHQRRCRGRVEFHDITSRNDLRGR